MNPFQHARTRPIATAHVEPDALYNVLREKPRKRMDPATKISLWITGVIAVILMYWIFS
jgi:hypothetical protein